MFRFISSVAERSGIVVCALLSAQMPLFMQHYEQQLVGRIAELKMQVEAIQTIANGRALDAYISKFITNQDPDISKHGELIQELIHRYYTLSDAYTNLQNATPLSKPFVFFTHLKSDIAFSTWNHFSFGLPLNLEGCCYALAGIIIGMGITKLLTLFFRRKIAVPRF